MNRIKELRIRDNVKQTDLASYLKVAAATLSGYETEKAQASIPTYQAIADYFNVSLDYLFGGAEDPAPKELPSPWPEATDRYDRLDELDRARVLAYMDGLLAAEKYCPPQTKRSAG